MWLYVQKYLVNHEEPSPLMLNLTRKMWVIIIWPKTQMTSNYIGSESFVPKNQGISSSRINSNLLTPIYVWDIWAQIVKVYYINIWKAQRVKLTWIKLGKFCNSEEKNKASSRISLDLVSYDLYLFICWWWTKSWHRLPSRLTPLKSQP